MSELLELVEEEKWPAWGLGQHLCLELSGPWNFPSVPSSYCQRWTDRNGAGVADGRTELCFLCVSCEV